MRAPSPGTRPVYGLVSFLGAFLLFFIQPFIAKAITPWFGGGSHVWLTCMVFAQVMLLLGYGYAHLLLTHVDAGRQARCHGVLLVLALGSLVFTWRWSGHPLLPVMPLAQASGPIWGVIRIQLLSVGLPLFVLSATAPLVQGWMHRTEGEAKPFRLYAFSNAGSLGGLLAYPFLAEPFSSLTSQAWLLGGMLVLYALPMAWLGGRVQTQVGVLQDRSTQPLQAPTVFEWVFMAFVGSVLLMAVTQVLNTELMGIPLLWVAPLFLYLLTFILAFEGRLSFDTPGWFFALGGVLFAALLALPWAFRHREPLWLVVNLLSALFSGCLLLHGRLYSLRPQAEKLSHYYLAISVGGVLGGMAVLWGAPIAFSRGYEMPLGFLMLAALLLGFRWQGAGQMFRPLVPWGIGLVAVMGLLEEGFTPGHSYRDLFGRVQVRIQKGGRFKEMLHGRTVHGAERLGEPLAKVGYHTPNSGVGIALAVARARKRNLNLGVLGLGVGNVLAFGQPGDRASVYEISPKIILLAGREAQEFTVLRSSPAVSEVFQGDGRFLLERQAEQGSNAFDVLLVDAFSGGNLPWHLLTLEAFRTYWFHLAPNGFLVINATNRLPLDRLVLANAQALGLQGLVIESPGSENPIPLEEGQRHSVFVVLARDWKTLDDARLLAPSRSVLRSEGKGDNDSLQARERLGQALAAQVRPWTDERNSLSRLLLLPRQPSPLPTNSSSK